MKRGLVILSAVFLLLLVLTGCKATSISLGDWDQTSEAVSLPFRLFNLSNDYEIVEFTINFELTTDLGEKIPVSVLYKEVVPVNSSIKRTHIYIKPYKPMNITDARIVNTVSSWAKN